MRSFFLGLVLFMEVSAYAAGSNSNGGAAAYICRNSSEQILSTQFVDLWESANSSFPWPILGEKKLTIEINRQDPMSTQMAEAKDRLKELDPFFGSAIAREVLVLQAATRYLNEGEQIALPRDIDTNLYPNGCPPEGLMRFHGASQKFEIDGKLFRTLASPTDVAASYLHEAIYKIYRGEREENAYPMNSRLARRFTACIFSKECSSAATFQAPKNPISIFSCNGSDFEGMLYQMPDSKMVFQVKSIKKKKYKIRFGFEADASNPENITLINNNFLDFFELSPYRTEFQLNIDGGKFQIFVSVQPGSNGYAYPNISFDEWVDCKK
jgi:hypothetical protein